MARSFATTATPQPQPFVSDSLGRNFVTLREIGQMLDLQRVIAEVVGTTGTPTRAREKLERLLKSIIAATPDPDGLDAYSEELTHGQRSETPQEESRKT